MTVVMGTAWYPRTDPKPPMPMPPWPPGPGGPSTTAARPSLARETGRVRATPVSARTRP